MKKINRIYIILLGLTIGFSSCNDLLDVEVPGTTNIGESFKTGEDAVKAVTAAYVPMQWELDETYYPEWFIGDVVSDDALKGGQNLGDMSMVYDMENFKTQSSNAFLLSYYRGQFQGVFRSNLVLEQVPLMKESDKASEENLKKRVLGEAYFLRAFYYFRLVRIFGGVPKIDFVIKAQADWKQPRASAEDIYQLIYADLLNAIPNLPVKSQYEDEDMGRATQGAARALLMKAYMNNREYAKAKLQADTIISSGEYQLCPDYADNFTLEGENGVESVFEIQYMDDPTSDYGGNGFSRGTFTPIMTRSRSNAAGGWGFNRPSQELYNSYEFGDPRRDITIFNPTDEQITNPAEEIYLGNRYHNRKYAMMNSDDTYIRLSHHARGPINKKEIRYADVLLMYAEACCEVNNLDQAKWALEQVRGRARSLVNGLVLTSFPYGSYSDNKDDLIKAIRHERRVELGMEGHRWFDLIRWGVAAETMNAYRQNASESIKKEMAVFEQGKHELFPIPIEEIEMNSMPQNPGY